MLQRSNQSDFQPLTRSIHWKDRACLNFKGRLA